LRNQRISVDENTSEISLVREISGARMAECQNEDVLF
jgi:hypothetical protein